LSHPMVMDIDGSGALEITFFFDFLCPFTYQASLWIREVRDVIGPEAIKVDWQFFSLEENNYSKTREGWHIWEQKADDPELKGLRPFLVGAAVEQAAGEDGLDKFYQIMGRMRHEENLDISERSHLEAALTEAGFEPKAYTQALEGKDQQGFEKIKRDHTQAVEEYGIFGVPALVFENQPGKTIFLKMMPRPTGTQAFELFQYVQRIALGLPMVQEIKRVTPAT